VEWRLIPEKVSVRGRVDPEEVSRLLDEGLTYREIARRLGVAECTVARWAKKLGKSRHKRSMTRVAVGLLKRGLSVAEVCRMTGMSKWYVQWLKRHLDRYRDVAPLSDREYMKLRRAMTPYRGVEERLRRLAPSLKSLVVNVEEVVEEALRVYRPGVKAKTILAVATLRLYPSTPQMDVCRALGVSEVAVRRMFRIIYGESLQEYRRELEVGIGDTYTVVETPLGKLLLTPKEEMVLRTILARAFARGGGDVRG